jgi:hypothetical protein
MLIWPDFRATLTIEEATHLSPSSGVRFRKACSFERCGRRELSRYFDRQKPHERTHLSCQHVFKVPKSSIFRTLSSRLCWRPIQEDVFFRALRAARAESLLRSSKAAREVSPKLPARLQSTKKQYFSHTQLAPSSSGRFRKTCSFESCGRRELSPTSCRSRSTQS